MSFVVNTPKLISEELIMRHPRESIENEIPGRALNRSSPSFLRATWLHVSVMPYVAYAFKPDFITACSVDESIGAPPIIKESIFSRTGLESNASICEGTIGRREMRESIAIKPEEFDSGAC